MSKRDGGDEIKALRKTVGGGGFENLSGATAEHEKESRDGITETGQIIDAPRPLYVSKSILKAQNEQVYKVFTPILIKPSTLL